MTSDDIRTRFQHDGFCVIPNLISADDLMELRTLYDAVLDGSIDCGKGDRMLGGRTRQIIRPSAWHAGFKDNAALRAGRALASAVFNCSEPVWVFDQLLYKPPMHPATTPWHQDLSYLYKPVTRAGVRVPRDLLQFWLPLDDVDEDTGCMHFLPGHSLDVLLPHDVVGGEPEDDARLLAISAAEQARLPFETIVACPLNAGDCTVHGPGTCHFTSANRSTSRHRRAYLFSFAPQPAIAL